jgi:two-component system sensor histidine kinase UhpB
MPMGEPSPELNRIFVECSALGFQATLLVLLAIACFVLYQRSRGEHFRIWAWAWVVYVVRISFMSTFLVRHDKFWLFAHQAATGVTVLLLLAAALRLARGFQLRPWHAIFVPLSILWAWITIYAVNSMMVAGITATVLMASLTIATGVVIWRARASISSGAAPVLAWSFVLWGVHHLDYPLLRSFGSAVLYGVFVDVLFLFAIALGLLFVVLGGESRKLASRTAQLEQLTRLLLRAQEDERRRIARELHDEAGQVLTAVKIELDLDGRTDAGALVGRALAQVRDLSNLLRPSVLDDLGLVAAVTALVDDFSMRTRISTTVDFGGATRRLPADIEVVIYRVVQEALTNIAKHAQASRASVTLTLDARAAHLTVEDDGRGMQAAGKTADMAEPHLGLLGMRERVTAAGGTLGISAGPSGGLTIDARIPIENIA